jgi:hypothetical protein
MLKENVKNIDDVDEVWKFYNLFVTHKHSKIHYCPTPNCKCVICGICWERISNNGKSIEEVTEDDRASIYDTFKCPYCMLIDWKYYMENVFDELQKTVLGGDEYLKTLVNKYAAEMENYIDFSTP